MVVVVVVVCSGGGGGSVWAVIGSRVEVDV